MCRYHGVMRWWLLTWCAAAWLVLFATSSCADEEDAEFFERHVRPVLAENCMSCHGGQKQKAGLRLDSKSGMLKGTDTGRVVVPGDPDASALIQAIRYQNDIKMPPTGKLSDDSIQALTLWIKRGANWPTERQSAAAPSASARAHWAFQSVKKPAIPAATSEWQPHNPVDAFVFAELQSRELSPSEIADRRTLIRRATFDLIGLPPTPEEIKDFVDDPSPTAFARVVDRLLASPAYGERWGRHWLDVAHYADTKGYLFTQERRFPASYTYRDYVIRAFNEDLPYDQFIIQQLAADQLPLGEDNRALAAMGFLTLGRRFLNKQPDIIDDRINVVTRGLLGLTVSCARCHDHKYDPIPTADYYSLYGVFANSVEPGLPPLIANPHPTSEAAAFEAELQTRQRKHDEFQAAKREELAAGFRSRAADLMIAATNASLPPGETPHHFLVSHSLPPRVVQDWKRYLERTRESHHPVFQSWNEFAALSQKDFAARARESQLELQRMPIRLSRSIR